MSDVVAFKQSLMVKGKVVVSQICTYPGNIEPGKIGVLLSAAKRALIDQHVRVITERWDGEEQ